MSLYDIISGTSAVASDVQQLVNIFNGKHDIGPVNLAPQLNAPPSGSFSLAAQAGSSLGVGAYNYQVTYVTGQYKSDGVTLVKTGESLPSSALSITTTSGNTSVKITLPTTSIPVSAIAFNIYRTSVGGSDYKLIATVKVGSANYIDSTSDASRGSAIPPSSNTTGTYINLSTVALGSPNQSIPASTDTQLTFTPNVGLNGDSSWAGNTWTCPVDGIYEIVVNSYVTIPTGAGVDIKLFVNGALDQYLTKYWNASTGAQSFASSGTALKKLSAGDTIKVYANPTASGALYNGNYSRCIIVKIG